MLKNWRIYLLIIVLGFLFYGQTLFFDFTYFDDQSLVLQNAQILKGEGLKGIFSNDAFFSNSDAYYRPLLNLSFWLELKTGSLSPHLFHLSNIFLHILAACLVYAIFKKLTQKNNLSLIASLLFLGHPILVQAVAWIPGRNDSLLTVFVLADFLAFVNFLNTKSLKSYILQFVFLLLAMLTKETAIFAVFVFGIYGLLFERRKQENADIGLLVLSWGLALFIYFLMRNLALEAFTGANLVNILSAIHNNFLAFILSAGKIIFPFNLSVLPTLKDSGLFFGFVVLSIFFLVLLFIKKDWRYFIFGFSWFIFFAAPSFFLQNVGLGVDFYLEQRMYLPLIGIFLMLISLDIVRGLDFNKKSIKFFGILLITIFFILTLIHSRDFVNKIVFWQAAINDSPSSALAHRNLGAMYYLEKDYKGAEGEYKKALELNPEEPMTHNNLGVIYLENNDLKRAEAEFQEELRVNPGYDKALFNIGELYYKQDKLDQARNFWTQALNINPRYGEAYNRLLNSEKTLR